MPEQREDDVAIEVEHLVKRFARSPRNATRTRATTKPLKSLGMGVDPARALKEE